jgi:hypothetical protein
MARAVNSPREKLSMALLITRNNKQKVYLEFRNAEPVGKSYVRSKQKNLFFRATFQQHIPPKKTSNGYVSEFAINGISREINTYFS